MAAQHAVARERGDRVVDRPVPTGDGAERVVAERLEVAAAAPLVGVAVVARVARVVRREHAGLGETRPHPVVHRVAGTAREARPTHRTGTHHHDVRAVLERVRDLLLGAFRILQRDVRRGVDAVVRS